MTDHRMTRPFGAAAVLALGLALLPAPAQAQFFGGWGGWDNGGTWDGLAPQQVRRAIAERGFRVLSPLRRNGSVFVADVLDGRGQHERLIVAAADAQILQRFIVDDGRQPVARGVDEGRGFVVRGADGERGLVPPADIPDGAGRRFARPADREAPPQRFGDLGTDEGGEAPTVLVAPPRASPPIRTVKPRPRVVERTPDVPARDPGAVESMPLAPAAPRPAAPPPAPAPVARAPAPVVASRPEPAPAPAAAPAPAPSASAVASRRMADPLAIPAGGDTKPVRNVAAGITGTPAPPPAATAPAKSGDVPVAPLD